MDASDHYKNDNNNNNKYYYLMIESITWKLVSHF